MKKLIITIITLVLIAITAKAQFIIITNTNDTIKCVISEKDNGIFHYQTITKPRHFDKINAKDIKSMTTIGEDTLYNIYSDIPTNNYVKDTATYDDSDVDINDNSAGGCLIRAGNNQILARIIYLTGGITGVIMAYNGNINGIYVLGTGVLVGSIIDFAASSLIIKAGKQLKTELDKKQPIK
jgi:uncharacterized protein YxeA